ncbi:MAG: hypothetical protein SF051_03570 [Elusimicrobiota bacterium]|nr:hypothetical protein [Elusimicrobiota bacterium]
MTMAYDPTSSSKKLSKKAAQAQQIQEELSPPWFPDAAWHLKTLLGIYALLGVVYFGVNALLGTLPRPYQLRKIPPEMTPWLAPGGKVHLPEEELRAPESPTLPPQPESRRAPSSKTK